MNDQTLSLRISRPEALALKRRARAEGISQGRLVRKALRSYGVTSDPAPAKTAYDVIKHIIGKNRGGPKDLSSNPKHLNDFGQ